MANPRATSCLKMSRERSHVTRARISGRSFVRSRPSANGTFMFLDLRNGQTPEWSLETDGACVGESSPLNTSESPNIASVCTLSSIAEANAPMKYSLSAKAAKGWLARMERAGKELPPPLLSALKDCAMR